MADRKPRSEKTYELDLTKPIDKTQLVMVDCFGKHWDMGSRECPQCADKDVCCILYKDYIDTKAKELAEKMGSNYLDEVDFDAVETAETLQWIKSGETTTKELLDYIGEISKCSDRKSVIEWTKNWIKRTSEIYTKDGLVWRR